MGLMVWTARLGYRGDDGLNVTRKSGVATFAPSWRILGPSLQAGREGRDVWDWYVTAYTEEMRTSYRDERAVWDALMRRDKVTLMCYCKSPAHCHRTILAGILGKLGGQVRGERTARQGLLGE
jgi:uncharacterized protein YeaO (DUF488 family)